MNHVYIISRGRSKNVPKLLTAWKQQRDFKVVFVVDPFECHLYMQEVLRANEFSDHDARVVSPGQDNLGLGYARKFAVEHAAFNDIGESFVMSDDDIEPRVSSDAALLCKTAARSDAIAVGARVPYHDWSMAPKDGLTKLRDFDRVVFCPSGMAFRLFGVNVDNAMELNFDPRFTCQNEDSEFMRGHIERGTPWLLDVRVEAKSIGARYTPGGVRNYLGDIAAEDVDADLEVKKCHMLAKQRWPDFVNAPTEPKIRTRWAKMYDTYMPGWRDRSAIHGGQLEWDGSER